MAQLHLRLADQLIKKKTPRHKNQTQNSHKNRLFDGKEFLDGTRPRIPHRKESLIKTVVIPAKKEEPKNPPHLLIGKI